MSQRIELTFGPHTLRGEHHTAPHCNTAILYAHGLGGHRGGEKSEALAHACRDAGIAFVAFDFRSHGESTGLMRELTASRLREDLNVIRDYLAQQGIHRYGMVGSSMGGFATAWHAVAHPESVVGCVLLAPAFHFVQRRWVNLTPNQREEWRIRGTWPLRNDWLNTELGYAFVEERALYTPEELASRWTTPTIIIHGLQDEIVSVHDSFAFINQAKYDHLELRVLKSGDHRLTTFKYTIAQTAVSFLSQHLNADRGK